MKRPHIFSIIILFFLCNFAYSQDKPSTLTIIVKNQLDQGISKAQITLTDSNKKQKQINTDKQGISRFANLPKGEFSIIVKVEGFKDFVGEPFIIKLGETKTIEINLELLPIESTVEIDQSQTVDKDNYGIRKVLTEEDLKNLPDNQKDFERAVRQILGQSITGEDLGITINGIPGGTFPPKESIQQIKVDQNIFSAKNSGPGGGGLQIITKAGMTKFGGGGAFSFADSRLDAKNPFVGQKIPVQNRGYRFNLEGPLTKKSSFSLSIDRFVRDSSTAVNATVLDNNLRIQSNKQTFPTPGISYGFNLLVNYDPLEKHKLFFNYGYQTSQGKVGVGGYSLPESLVKSNRQNHRFSLSHQYLVNAFLTNRTTFSFDYSKDKSVPSNSNPVLIVSDAFSSGSSANASNRSYNLSFSNDTEKQVGKMEYEFGFSLRLEKRTIISQNNFNGTYLFTGKIAPLLDADNNPLLDANGQVITGQISSIESYRRNLLFRQLGYSASQIRQLGGSPDQFTISGGNHELSVSQIEYSFYFQSSHKINETIGIGAGLRYENQTNIKSNFNLSPRLNLTFQPKANEKKKAIWSLPRINAGGGIYFSKYGLFNTISERQLNSPDRVSYLVRNSTVLDVFPNVPSIDFLEKTTQSKSKTFTDPNLKNPVQITFNISIVKNITKKIGLNFSYSHSNDFRAFMNRNINAPLAGTFSASNQNSAVYPLGVSGTVYKKSGIGKAVGDRFMISPRLPRFKFKKYEAYLNLSYSFSTGKSNNVSGSGSPFDPYDFSEEFSPTATDGIHSFNFMYLQNLPFNSRLMFSGSIRSGSCFNITTGRDTNGDGYYTERPAFASNPNKAGVVATPYGLLDPNPAAGDKIIPRNLARGPMASDYSLSFNKNFGFNKDEITKRFKQELSFNISVSNVFNINNKGIPVGNMSSPNFVKFLNNNADPNGGGSNPRSFNFNLGFRF